MNQIKVSAPGKLMLFGEHAVIYDRPCIVTAVDHRISTKVKIINKPKLVINAPEVEVINYQKDITNLTSSENMPKGVRFLETAIKNYLENYQIEGGLEIETKSEFSSQFGFGSSSAVTVGVLKALSILTKISLSNQDLFDLAYKTVLDVQGVGSGFDIAAGIWGGTLYFITGGKQISPLKKSTLPLVVGYTGIKAKTPPLVRQVESLHQDCPLIADSFFDIMTLITNQAQKTLNKNKLNFIELGHLMNFNQGLLDGLGVNTIELAKLIFAARNAGAKGAKLSGAGGGDCMIALVEKGKIASVKEGIKKAGGKIIPIKNGASGVKIER